jgi:hypothetical protein
LARCVGELVPGDYFTGNGLQVARLVNFSPQLLRTPSLLALRMSLLNLSGRLSTADVNNSCEAPEFGKLKQKFRRRVYGEYFTNLLDTPVLPGAQEFVHSLFEVLAHSGCEQLHQGVWRSGKG